MDGYVAIATFANGMFSTNVTATSAFQVAQQNRRSYKVLQALSYLTKNYQTLCKRLLHPLHAAGSSNGVLRVTNTLGRNDPETSTNQRARHSIEWEGQMWWCASRKQGHAGFELAVTLSNGTTMRRTGQMIRH